jgi:hypothetical protein
MKIYRQLSYNTYPNAPSSFPTAEDKYFTQFEMVKEPEQERYTAVLAISHTDLTRPEEVYVFIPSLRRYQPLSPAARCSPDLGTDETPDDRRYGFDSNLTQHRQGYICAIVGGSIRQTDAAESLHCFLPLHARYTWNRSTGFVELDDLCFLGPTN